MHEQFRSLYFKYQNELVELTRVSKKLYDKFISRGLGATFSDIEAELLYLLIREHKPSNVFEISPDCGYSTHYILSALQKNNSGKLFSFELSKTTRDKPTDQVIRENQMEGADLSRLNVIIGDARITTAQLNIKPDFIFLDSCHDDFFAEWYVNFLLPKCSGAAFIHDIMYAGQVPELASESFYLQSQLINKKCPVSYIGDFESVFLTERKTMQLSNRRAWSSISAFIPDCGPFKNSQTQTSEEKFVRFLTKANHTQSIQGIQIVPWKNSYETIESNDKNSQNQILNVGDFQDLILRTPLTILKEVRAGGLKISKPEEWVDKISDVFSKSIFLKYFSLSKKIISKKEINFVNPIEFLELLKRQHGDISNLELEKLLSDPSVLLYWKIEIIKAANRNNKWIIEKINQLLPSVLHSNIANKLSILEISPTNKFRKFILEALEPSLLENIERNQIAFRHLLKILIQFKPYLSENLIHQIENFIFQSIQQKPRAKMEVLAELLVSFKFKDALNFYRKLLNKKSSRPEQMDWHYFKHFIYSKSKNRLIKLYRAA
ncbi:MAG: class I SAM-dependent methyltransferase [Deltaproteobacteria bacterium]|nr:class I SAM-dependent methyltransferase [Deltaproteobacteria bacterium]